MQNKSLANDYIKRCKARLLAIDCLYDQESWADVVRECQEVVELALKACLRHFNIEAPRIHDVSVVLESEAGNFTPKIKKEIPNLVRISKTLRRDRELAFYGSEDLTPSEFYSQEDADKARESAQFVVKCVASTMA